MTCDERQQCKADVSGLNCSRALQPNEAEMHLEQMFESGSILMVVDPGHYRPIYLLAQLTFTCQEQHRTC